ncbi:hypothetical protein H9Y04_15995 [Streptomyces sp. TRM66268-LWL]|uniref:Uncharacterized protein n=1 Tax=Streptomyces polyasparticus TaxID=2767826 RepID=A0ABR7SEY9_9ACTN|nr:hypothetical protein [Streptomyces polyasparticus]MBC9714066.1 hypothetical protein [Streptomyces polyasparticus]
MTALTLPVRLTVGEHTVEVGELTLGADEQVRPALATLFRRAADACETTMREGGDDGTP